MAKMMGKLGWFRCCPCCVDNPRIRQQEEREWRREWWLEDA